MTAGRNKKKKVMFVSEIGMFQGLRVCHVSLCQPIEHPVFNFTE